MAEGAAGCQEKMRDFVSRFFKGNPDLSIITHSIVQKIYLDYAGLKNLSQQEKDLLKQLVEEELIQMKVDIKTEPEDSFKSEDHKRPIYISLISEDEIENEKKPKRQKIENTIEISSSEKDSEIDSKKGPCHGAPKLTRISDSSGQGDSRAGNHSTKSESDEATTRSKRKPSFQEARWETGQGRKSPNSPGISGLQKRWVGGPEEIDTEQSDLEEVKECRKVTKGNSLKQRAKKELDKGSKDNGPKGKAKNKTMNKQRDKTNRSEEGTDLSDTEEISEKKREWSESKSKEKKSFSANKAEQRVSPGTQKDSTGSKNGPNKKKFLQKTMTDRQCQRKSRIIEDLGSSSEDSANQSPVRKERAKRFSGERGSQQTGKHSKPKRQPKEREERKKLQREDRYRRKVEKVRMILSILESTSEESESGSGERKSWEEEEWVQDSSSSEGESQSEMNQGQSRKAVLISSPSESESDEDQRRTLERKSQCVSESDSSQGEKKLKSGAQKSQRKSISRETSPLSSEDLGSEYKGKEEIQSQQGRRTKKLQRRSATEEKQGEESSQEEGSSSEADKATTSQKYHPGKDKKQCSGKNKENPFVQRLKRYIRECGVHQNYKKLLAGCHSHKTQIQTLKKELGSLGIKGTPSLAKCKALKKAREVAAEMAYLDMENIIPTEGRPKRCNVWSLYNRPQESPSLPEEPTVCCRTTDWSQLQEVISLDTESS